MTINECGLTYNVVTYASSEKKNTVVMQSLEPDKKTTERCITFYVSNGKIAVPKVLEVDEKCVLVAPLEGEAELRSSDKIYVSVWKLKQIPEIKAGNILEIRYDGMIQETYPAQINGIYSIAVIE